MNLLSPEGRHGSNKGGVESASGAGGTDLGDMHDEMLNRAAREIVASTRDGLPVLAPEASGRIKFL